jgi:protein gp37
MKIEWVREIRDLCEEKDIAFFFKQYGKKFNNPDLFDDTIYKKIDGTTNPLYAKGGCLLDGKIYQNYPNN